MAWTRIEGSSNSEDERRLHTSSDGLGFFVIAIGVAGVLAMVAVWFLVAYYPIPDDEALYLGLLAFLFVLFVTFPLAILRFLQGRGLASIKASLNIAVLGLIAAAALDLREWASVLGYLHLVCI